jgi:positive regulator of sigma E activity
MTERATVRRVSDREVTLEMGSLAACGGCSACGLFGPRRPQTLRAANNRGLDLQPGDIVEVGFSGGKAVRAGFLVLILPLILFLGAFAAVGSLGVTSEPLKVLAGLLGLAAGLGLAFLRGRSHADLPEVTRLAPRGSAPPSTLCGMADTPASHTLTT